MSRLLYLKNRSVRFIEDEKVGAVDKLIEKQRKQELPGIFAIGVEEKCSGKGKKKFQLLPSSVNGITNGVSVAEEVQNPSQSCSGRKKVMIPTGPLIGRFHSIPIYSLMPPKLASSIL